jgi:replication initiation and membrane attachment protein DnaB
MYLLVSCSANRREVSLILKKSILKSEKMEMQVELCLYSYSVKLQLDWQIYPKKTSNSIFSSINANLKIKIKYLNMEIF